MKLLNIDSKLNLKPFKKIIDSVDSINLKRLFVRNNKLLSTNKYLLVYKNIDINGNYDIPQDFIKKIKNISDLKKYTCEEQWIAFEKVIEKAKNDAQIKFKVEFPKFIRKCKYCFWYKNNIYTAYDDVFVSKSEFIIPSDYPAFTITSPNALLDILSEKKVEMSIPSEYNNGKVFTIKSDDLSIIGVMPEIDKTNVRIYFEKLYGDELNEIMA